jgi:hypothetical protein
MRREFLLRKLKEKPSGNLDLRNRKIIFEEHYVLEPCFMNVINIEPSVNILSGNMSKLQLKNAL